MPFFLRFEIKRAGLVHLVGHVREYHTIAVVLRIPELLAQPGRGELLHTAVAKNHVPVVLMQAFAPTRIDHIRVEGDHLVVVGSRCRIGDQVRHIAVGTQYHLRLGFAGFNTKGITHGAVSAGRITRRQSVGQTKEIGLRKAIGAKKGDINFQFLTEAIMLTLIGGIVGIFFGWLASYGVSHFGGIATKISWFSIILGFGVSAAIGIIFGYYPARRASGLNPIEALRYE